MMGTAESNVIHPNTKSNVKNHLENFHESPCSMRVIGILVIIKPRFLIIYLQAKRRMLRYFANLVFQNLFQNFKDIRVLSL